MASKYFYDTFKAAAETVMPVLSTSQFKDKGVLTPEEFVEAGDLLVLKCPTWSWETGDPKLIRSYLPRDKQFLITRNVPCYKRVKSLEEGVVDDDQAMDGDWTTTHVSHDSQSERVEELEDMPDMDGSAPERLDLSSLAKAVPTAAADGSDDDVPDMDEFEDTNIVQADDGKLAAGSGAYIVREEPTDPILRTRSYDLSITYDKYYQTPRVWLFGYDEERKPLKPEQTFEDMSQDHARKTVTIDPHPHYQSIAHASIHPCRHAEVMKRMCDMAYSEATLRVDQYLFIFLKLISAVIPTIQYDFTVEMDMRH